MDSDTENDPMMDSDSEEERNKPSKNKDTEKLLFKEEGIKCNICESTFCWQSGLRAHLKSIDTGKIKFNQYQYIFASSENLKITLFTITGRSMKKQSVMSVIGVLSTQIS